MKAEIEWQDSERGILWQAVAVYRIVVDKATGEKNWVIDDLRGLTARLVVGNSALHPVSAVSVSGEVLDNYYQIIQRAVMHNDSSDC